MRLWSLLLVGAAACGPIYPDQQPSRPPDPAAAGAPGGAPSEPGGAPGGPPGATTDPWSEPGAEPAPPPDRAPSAPADPYAATPDDPYASPRPAPKRPPPAPPAPKPEPPASKPAKPGGLTADAQAILDAHNRYRAQHCAGPLTWSPKLAQVAQQWASSLRDQGCKFGHSNGRYGENLAAGTSGTLDGKAVTAMWYDEVKLYKFPDGGFSMETGHFTQVVWKGTSQLGCGVSSCKGMDIWVCEYEAAGNVQGQFRQNVLPTTCR